MTQNRSRVSGIARLILVSTNAERLANFYEHAFGARVESRECCEDASISVLLALGAQKIELRTFDPQGRPYPADADASDIAFQHFAIVVSDIDAAFRRLQSIPSGPFISRVGPQRLPARSGSVTAFKFRDPEGHPLELLQFARDNAPARWRPTPGSSNVLGIDHTAISVADNRRSIAFYESLGLSVTSRSVNIGAEQDQLDGLAGIEVEVTALSAAERTPHLELLCYRDRRKHSGVDANDVAATRIVFRSGGSHDENLVDPDGHRLVIAAVGA